DPVCGKACSAGDAQIPDGHCVPSFLLVQAKSKASSRSAGVERQAVAIVGGSARAKLQPTVLSMANAGSQRGAAQFEGRMGLAGPPTGLALGATIQAPRKRTTRAEKIAAQPRLGSAQHWSATVFSPRISNN